MSTRNVRLIHVVCMAALVAAAFGSLPAAAQDGELDLPAILIHPDDLDWIVEEQGSRGFLDDAPFITGRSAYFTIRDEVLGSQWYLDGRGGLVPGNASSEVEELLDESGWIRSSDELLLRQASVVEGEWVYGIGASIEEYGSSDGAELAFDTLNDAETLADITGADDVVAMEAPDLGDQSAMWSLQSVLFGSPPVPVISIWVQVDNFIVSLSAADASQVTEPDPAVVRQMVEFQLQRLDLAEHMYQPHLSGCAPRLAGDDVFARNDSYVQLNGKRFGVWYDTNATVQAAEDEAAEQGIVDYHRVIQDIAGSGSGAEELMYHWGETRAFVDDRHASDYLESADEVVEAIGVSDLVELDDVPELGGAARAFHYVGDSEFWYTVIYVQEDAVVTSIKLGPSTEPLPDQVYGLASSYLERIERGDCKTPIGVPDGLELVIAGRHSSPMPARTSSVTAWAPEFTPSLA